MEACSLEKALHTFPKARLSLLDRIRVGKRETDAVIFKMYGSFIRILFSGDKTICNVFSIGVGI